MTRERAKELLPMLQAFAEGKVVQWSRNGGGDWKIAVDVISFEYVDHMCRIKPESREWYIAKDLDTKELTIYPTEGSLVDCIGLSSAVEIIKVKEVLD